MSKFPEELTPPPYISVAEASKISKLTPGYIRRRIREGKIKGFKMGRDWFTTEAALQDYLAQDRRPGPKPTKR